MVKDISNATDTNSEKIFQQSFFDKVLIKTRAPHLN